jgi:hypothetical protein
VYSTQRPRSARTSSAQNGTVTLLTSVSLSPRYLLNHFAPAIVGIIVKRLVKAIACATMLLSASAAVAQTTNGDARESAVGHASVAEAYDALRAKPGVTFSKNADWTVATDTDGALWSFTPSNHPAHPSVGRRRLLRHSDGGWFVETGILCQAEKAACDKLYADYQLLDRRMTEAIRTPKQAPPSR